MFELPEVLVLSAQINETLQGKTIARGTLGNSPHKFVWYNRTHEEFEALTKDKTVGESYTRGRWLFIPLEPGFILLIGECGGKMFYHLAGAKLPKKYHLLLTFEDGSFYTITTQMWGAMELHEKGEETEREYVKDMRTTPVDPAFTFDYFIHLIEATIQEGKRSAKGLLTQDQLIPGLGNSIAQDILFQARIHPRRSIGEMDNEERRALYDSILETVKTITQAGGRNDEYDLHGQRGGYIRLMDSKAAGNPCPKCGTIIKKIQYLGGSCYFCPQCQMV